MKTLIELQTTFGARALELYTGVAGLRGVMHFEIRAVADGDGEFDLDFIGSDNSMDRYNEVIEPTAWGDMKNFRANPVIPDCHDYSSVAKILARAKSVAVVNGKLCNRCTFAMDNPLGAMAFNQINSGQKVHGIASAHGAVAATTAISYGAAIIAVSWPIHLKF